LLLILNSGFCIGLHRFGGWALFAFPYPFGFVFLWKFVNLVVYFQDVDSYLQSHADNLHYKISDWISDLSPDTESL